MAAANVLHHPQQHRHPPASLLAPSVNPHRSPHSASTPFLPELHSSATRGTPGAASVPAHPLAPSLTLPQQHPWKRTLASHLLPTRSSFPLPQRHPWKRILASPGFTRQQERTEVVARAGSGSAGFRSGAGAGAGSVFPELPAHPSGPSIRISDWYTRQQVRTVVAAAAAAGSGSVSPAVPVQPPAPSVRLSDAIWPGIGAFMSYCGLAALDHLVLPKKLTMSLASFAALSCLLFTAPKAPASQRHRVLLAHLGSAFVGVATMSVLGSTWLARSVAVGLSISFMLLADCMHPPAAGLPVIFIDGPKFHHLGWWYPIFPAFAGCLWLFLMQEVILFLKDRVQF